MSDESQIYSHAEEMKVCRENANMSARLLAKKMGVHPHVVLGWEDGSILLPECVSDAAMVAIGECDPPPESPRGAFSKMAPRIMGHSPQGQLPSAAAVYLGVIVATSGLRLQEIADKARVSIDTVIAISHMRSVLESSITRVSVALGVWPYSPWHRLSRSARVVVIVDLLGLSNEELGEIIGISSTTVNRAWFGREFKEVEIGSILGRFGIPVSFVSGKKMPDLASILAMGANIYEEES